MKLKITVAAAVVLSLFNRKEVNAQSSGKQQSVPGRFTYGVNASYLKIGNTQVFGIGEFAQLNLFSNKFVLDVENITYFKTASYFNTFNGRLGLRANFMHFFDADKVRQDISKGPSLFVASGIGIRHAVNQNTAIGVNGKIGLEYFLNGAGFGLYYGGTGFDDMDEVTTQFDLSVILTRVRRK
jgi:hypothetical protein